jgi:hypothetical protein
VSTLHACTLVRIRKILQVKQLAKPLRETETNHRSDRSVEGDRHS